jgi:hypothetical protein
VPTLWRQRNHFELAIDGLGPQTGSAGPLTIDVPPIYAYYTYMSTTWDPKKAQANLRKHGSAFPTQRPCSWIPAPSAATTQQPTMSAVSCHWGWTLSEELWCWCTPTAMGTYG